MANLKSSQKDIRRIEKRTARNRVIMSRLKTLRKKATAVVETGDAEQMAAVAREYSSALDKAAKTGTIHGNRANREKSRIVAAINKKKAATAAA